MSRKSTTRQDDPLKGGLLPEDKELFKAAWNIARKNHGRDLTFYLPGMIRYGAKTGCYPAISLTGNSCQLQCEHCRGKLLEPMLKTTDPVDLVQLARRLRQRGSHGILLTGGAGREGRLPWPEYYKAIGKIKRDTGLFLSAHTGFPDYNSCSLLHKAGLDQALIDVIGDHDTANKIYHLSGLDPILGSLNNIKRTGLELVPHIVAGLFYGKIKGEYRALDIIHEYRPNCLVFVVLTPLKGTPMARIAPPSPLEVVRLIAKARLLMPETPISLGCERPRDQRGVQIERLAMRAGITRMAVWSEEALEEARILGLAPRFQATCCSVPYKPLEYGTC